MHYKLLAEYEVIRCVLEQNPGGRSAKQIANYFNMSLSNIYKWGEDPASSGTSIPKQYIIPFCIYAQDHRLIEWYASQIDRRTISMGKGRDTNGIVSDDLFQIDSLRGQLAEILQRALKDNIIDQGERKILRNTMAKIIEECQSFIEELKLDQVKFS